MKLHNSIHDVVVVAVVVVVEKVVPNRYNGNELLTDLFIMFRISCNVSSIHSYNFLKASYSFFFFSWHLFPFHSSSKNAKTVVDHKIIPKNITFDKAQYLQLVDYIILVSEG